MSDDLTIASCSSSNSKLVLAANLVAESSGTENKIEIDNPELKVVEELVIGKNSDNSSSGDESQGAWLFSNNT